MCDSAFRGNETGLCVLRKSNKGSNIILAVDINSYMMIENHSGSQKGAPMISHASTRNSQFIKASREAVYRAFTEPAALETWLVPGDMTGKVHNFDHRVGGGYQMSLYYPSSEDATRGKTADREDRYTARFVELRPPERIVETINFDSSDPSFAGEMIMEATFEAEDGGTTVSLVFKNLPSGIRPEDNETGTKSSLEKLALYVEGQSDR
jgi:uncharacterized protein YndB with AHSA1/START domain